MVRGYLGKTRKWLLGICLFDLCLGLTLGWTQTSVPIRILPSEVGVVARVTEVTPDIPSIDLVTLPASLPSGLGYLELVVRTSSGVLRRTVLPPGVRGILQGYLGELSFAYGSEFRPHHLCEIHDPVLLTQRALWVRQGANPGVLPPGYSSDLHLHMILGNDNCALGLRVTPQLRPLPGQAEPAGAAGIGSASDQGPDERLNARAQALVDLMIVLGTELGRR